MTVLRSSLAMVVNRVMLVAIASGMAAAFQLGSIAEASSMRRSAIVRAVEQARPSVVNINGQKLIHNVANQYGSDTTKRVNGMGTGVVIDERGYVLTNFHVVDGVRRIRVTLASGRAYIARLVAHDPATDLAIIKLPVKQRMKVIRAGSSRDIMTGETVIAMGNAYGYEHTVTTGIISAQHRSVEVNDTQEYHDLLQTDASINPGNSGGPLLNVDGDMIGINVAVRVGAQGIGFAIPVDRAMQVAARLMSVERVIGLWHGIVPEEVVRDNQRLVVVVREVKSGSPAQKAGVKQGDVIRRVAGQSVVRALDFERALLGLRSGDAVPVAVERRNEPVDVQLALASFPSEGTETTAKRPSLSDQVWKQLGVRLRPSSAQSIGRRTDRFRGGLDVTEIRDDGIVAKQGIQPGDILVGMHIWETISMENVAYVLQHADLDDVDSIDFFVLRGKETLAGKIPIAWIR